MTNYSSHPNARAIPDPNDRTPNDPAVLIESKHVRHYVDLYGIEIHDTYANAYIGQALKHGWANSDIEVIGKSVLLKANVEVLRNPE